jgi:hypothetical protein
MDVDEIPTDDVLVIDPLLVPAWDDMRVRGVQLLGLAGEISEDSTRAGAVVVTDVPLAEAAVRYLAGQVEEVLQLPTELLALDDREGDLTRLLRQWIDQAAQGVGRGVHLDLEIPPTGEPIQARVKAADSSARELTMRLASAGEAALAALETLLCGRTVLILNVDDLEL